MAEFPQKYCNLTHRVSYGETDTMGVLYYAEYLHLFERARSEHIRNHGLSYKQVEEKNIYMPVREAQCRYRKSAHYDDLLNIHVAISEWGRASVRFVYQIWNENKEILLADGMTQHAFINKDGKPVAVPTWLKELYI